MAGARTSVLAYRRSILHVFIGTDCLVVWRRAVCRAATDAQTRREEAVPVRGGVHHPGITQGLGVSNQLPSVLSFLVEFAAVLS